MAEEENEVEGVEITAPDAEPVDSEPVIEALSPSQAREEGERPRRRKRGTYELGQGRIGKSINSIMIMIEKRFPDLQGQLVLEDWEIELLDDAFKPLLEKYLKQAKFPASNVEIVFAVIILMLPRVLAVVGRVAPLKKVEKK